jgi:uncharacterized protein (TIGR02466 family)
MNDLPYDLQSFILNEIDDGCQTNLFPTPVFEFNLANKIDFKRIEKFIESYHKDYKENWNKYSQHDIISTEDNLHMDSRFSELVSLLNSYVHVVMNRLNIENNGYHLLGLWANIHRRCTTHHSHQHPNSLLSGVLYVNVPKNSGALYFEDPRDSKTIIEYNSGSDLKSMYQYRSWEFLPKVGKLIIFPSWLRHGTQPSSLKDGEYRISMSFNVYPKYHCTRNTMRITL